MDNLTAIIKSRGFKVTEYPKRLGMSYSNFNYYVKAKTMPYNVLKFILEDLNIKFEDLEEYRKKKEKMINLKDIL